MTPAGETLINIDDDVDFLTEQIAALKKLAPHGDDGDLYDLSVRWGAALSGRLPRLAHYSSLGLLDDENQDRFRALCDELRDVSDLADSLGLVRPMLPGDRHADPGRHHRFRMRSRLPKRRRGS